MMKISKKQRHLLTGFGALLLVCLAIAIIANKAKPEEVVHEVKSYWDIIKERVDSQEEISRFETGLRCYEYYSWDEATTITSNATYRFGLTIPDEVLPDGLEVVVDVNYPEEVKAGEAGIITMTAKDEHGNVWCGQYNFIAEKDLSFAHGHQWQDDKTIFSDGIWNVGDFDRGVVVELCTSAKDAENYDEIIADSFAARTGACPTTLVYFHQN